MTPEAQRIAIAEACGWNPLGGGEWMTPDCKNVGGIEDLPEYLQSLDAMHEAENALTPLQVVDYVEWLREIESSSDDFQDLVHVAASQRAKAFLRTLNLWKP